MDGPAPAYYALPWNLDKIFMFETMVINNDPLMFAMNSKLNENVILYLRMEASSCEPG